MYFSFFKLKKWGKKTAETRRRNCTVLPYLPQSYKAPLFRITEQRRNLFIQATQSFTLAAISSSQRDRNSSSGMAPRSSPFRVRTETVPFSISRSPTTSI